MSTKLMKTITQQCKPYKNLVFRLVRLVSAWAWKPVVWDRVTIYELHYRHTNRTYAGDMERTQCMSRWTSLGEAQEAERRAWEEYGWKKLEPKKDGTITWIEEAKINSLPNAE